MSGDTLTGLEHREVSTSSPSLVLEMPGDEGPSYFHNELPVSGRAVGADQVTIRLAPFDADGNAGEVVVSLEERLHDFGAPERRFDLQLPTRDCSPGPHSLTVAAAAEDGSQLLGQRTVTIEPYEEASEATPAAIETGAIALCCEVPRPGHTDELGPRVFIRGWCYTTGGIEGVVTFIDGGARREALFPVPRLDVKQALGRPDALLSGFALPLDAQACPAGEHSLTVLVTGSGGRRVGRSLTFRRRAAGPEEDSTSADATVHAPMDRDQGDFECLRATIAERHAFLSLTESNIVTEGYEALRRSKLALQQELDATRRALEQAERRAADAEQRATAAEHWLDDQRRSLSWRVTEPLRAAKRVARRIRR
jgi:hypothetical protein